MAVLELGSEELVIWQQSGMHDREGRCRRTTGKAKIAVAMWGPLGTERRALP